MNKNENGKKTYEAIEIPKELHPMTERLIAGHEKKTQPAPILRFPHSFSKKGTLAAACLTALIIGLNTSEAFANAAAAVPLLGPIAQVLTVRSYHGEEEDFELDIDVPQIHLEENSQSAAENTSFTDQVNQEIREIVENYEAEARKEFAEYKDAFFATGGTEEEWAGRTMDLTVNYSVTYQTSPILSLTLTTAKGWVAAQEERHFYNLNLQSGKRLTLEDVLGSDYVSLANQSIDRQILERIAADGSLSYFGYDNDDSGLAEGFTTVTENTDFYINEHGNVVIVFEKYEIAPGYMGFQEFEIGPANL